MRQLSLFKGKRQRGAKPPEPLERHTHIALADALDLWCDPLWDWTHYPAGELRTDRTAALLQRMGTKPGWADFLLVDPASRLHCLELKRGRAPLNDAQKAFMARCRIKGTPYEVARSYSEAISVLKLWGAIPASVMT